MLGELAGKAEFVNIFEQSGTNMLRLWEPRTTYKDSVTKISEFSVNERDSYWGWSDNKGPEGHSKNSHKEALSLQVFTF
jgi:hypothetical protein